MRWRRPTATLIPTTGMRTGAAWRSGSASRATGRWCLITTPRSILANMPSQPPPEPWRLIEGFRDMPALLVSGALSDILSAETAAEMARRLPRLEWLALPRVGHVPLLDEAGVLPAIDRLLARAEGRD